MEQLLKAKLLALQPAIELDSPESVAEEYISIDMDFAENYDVWHKIELQSEHWAHNSVTLYIVILHFRAAGVWKEEAHVFISADGAHDTFFVQRVMAGTLISR